MVFAENGANPPERCMFWGVSRVGPVFGEMEQFLKYFLTI